MGIENIKPTGEDQATIDHIIAVARGEAFVAPIVKENPPPPTNVHRVDFRRLGGMAALPGNKWANPRHTYLDGPEAAA